MVGTQAKRTKEYLDKAKDIILEAIKTSNRTNLQAKLEKELDLMPAQALVLVNELARYEAEYAYKKIKKYTPKADKSGVVQLTENSVQNVVNSTLINTSLQAPKRTIENSYKQFAQNKVRQYMQIVSDAELQDLDYEELEAQLDERTSGLFATQNLALAGLSLLSIASNIRNETASENLLEVEWSLDLELNNCPYCEEMADGGPYDPEDVIDEVPAHSNCGCTLIPIFDAI